MIRGDLLLVAAGIAVGAVLLELALGRILGARDRGDPNRGRLELSRKAETFFLGVLLRRSPEGEVVSLAELRELGKGFEVEFDGF